MACILVVDDRPSNRQFLVTLLGYGGHSLIEAADGAEALEQVQARRPDLVITDILMPNTNGYEFVQLLRADPALAATPVIFYTASYSAPQAEALGRSCGVHKVLAKPSEPAVILAAVNAALGVTGLAAESFSATGNAPGAGALAQPVDDSINLYLRDLNEVRARFEDVVARSVKLRSERDSIKELSKKFADNVAAMQRVTSRLSALLEVGMEMMTERDPARLVELFFGAACDLVASRYAAVGMLDASEQSVEHVFAKGVEAGLLRGERGRSGLLGTLLSGHRVLRMHGADGAGSAEGLPPGHPPVQDLLGIPVVSAGRVYGWMYFADSRDTEGFSDEDVRVATVMTRKLALLYENAMLYDEIQRHAAQLQIEIGERRRTEQALAQSEAGLQRAQLMARLAQVVTGPQGEFETWSDTLPLLIGVEPSRMPASTREWLQLVHPEDRALFRAKALGAGARSERADLEYRVRRADGAWIHIRQAMEPLERNALATGRPRWFNTLQDITEERRAAEQLRESELRFRQLAENIREVFWLTDPSKNQILYVSPGYEAIWGRSCEQLYASPREWIDAIHPDDRGRVLQAAQTKQAQGEYREEYRIVRPDGTIRWIRDRAFPVLKDNRVYRIAGTAEDITEARLAEDELRESERRFSDMLGKVELVSLMLDREARITYGNDYLLRLTGWRREELLGRDWFEVLIPPDTQNVRKVFADLIADLPSAWHHENEILTQGGERRLIRWNNSVLRSASGEVIGTASIGEDITEQKQAERKIRKLNRVYAVLSGINTLIVRVRDRDELFREACRVAVEQGQFRLAWVGLVDPATEQVKAVASGGDVRDFFASTPWTKPAASRRGFAWQAITERRPMISNDVQSDPRSAMKEQCRERGINSLVVLPLVVGGEGIGVLALYAAEAGFFDDEEMTLLAELAGDISFALDHLQKAEKLDYLAYYDALTGLANRAHFHQRLKQQVELARRADHKLAVLVLDLDRFKIVNDSLGRDAGDELLRQVAQRMRQVAADPGSLARISADRFAIVRPDVRSGDEVARHNEQKLGECFGAPFRIGETELRVSAKVGIALFPDDGQDADSLFTNAEAALKRAKASGASYLFYLEEMSARIGEHLALESKLRRAIEREEFVLHYQPKVGLEDRRVVGVEALIRWQDPETGLVPPGRFIPLLEETGMILEVGAWAIRRAILDHRHWLRQGLKAPRVAVNVSQIQMRQQDFVELVSEAVAQGANPTGLDLEITESLLMQDIKTNVVKLDAIRKLGVDIAIDDFGTGYSSLAYLAKLPVQALKIDRSFIIAMLKDPAAMALVQTIISLAHALRLKVVAEGVETEEQANILRLLRCDEMQGYLISKPKPIEEITPLLLERG